MITPHTETIYHADIVYGVDPNTRLITTRYNTDDIHPMYGESVEPESREPIWCSGLGYLDFIIKGSVTSEYGATDVDHLLATYNVDKAELYPVDLVVSDPSHYLTREMARRIATLSRLEAEELGLDDAILREFDRKFPDVHPFSPR